MNALHAGTPTCDTGRMARRTSRFPRVCGLVLAVADTDVELHYIDPEIEGFDTEVFAGQGTVTIVAQDPDVRAFAYEVDGSLTSEDDESRSVDVDYAYTASIIC